MADKFGLNYVLTVQEKTGESVIIKPPFTIELDITRNTLTSANVCQVKIYNLGAKTRGKIHRNKTDWGAPFQGISLEAGYGTNLTEVFNGNISASWSVREGVNYITQIECFDGGFAFVNSKTNRSFPAGTPQTAIIASMTGDLDYVKPGVVGKYDGILLRGNSYSGNTVQLLRELTGGGLFIDKSTAHCLGDAEYIINGGTIAVNAGTGLLQTPVLERTIAHFDMLFEPGLNVGRLANITSVSAPQFNGIRKIVEVKHRGMISEAVASSVVTTGGFFYSKSLTGVQKI